MPSIKSKRPPSRSKVTTPPATYEQMWAAYTLGASGVTLSVLMETLFTEEDDPNVLQPSTKQMAAFLVGCGLNNAARCLTPPAKLLDRFFDAVETILLLTVPSQQVKYGLECRAELMKAAVSVLGPSRALERWFGLGLSLGMCLLGARAAMMNCIRKHLTDLPPEPVGKLTQRRIMAGYRPPSLTPIFAAAAAIGFDGATGVAPVR